MFSVVLPRKPGPASPVPFALVSGEDPNIMAQEAMLDALMNCCESLYFQCVAMETILAKLAPEEWRPMLAAILDSDEASEIRASFHNVLDAAMDRCDPVNVSQMLRPSPRRVQ